MAPLQTPYFDGGQFLCAVFRTLDLKGRPTGVRAGGNDIRKLSLSSS